MVIAYLEFHVLAGIDRTNGLEFKRRRVFVLFEDDCVVAEEVAADFVLPLDAGEPDVERNQSSFESLLMNLAIPAFLFLALGPLASFSASALRASSASAKATACAYAVLAISLALMSVALPLRVGR
jgi:hypothetical protein